MIEKPLPRPAAPCRGPLNPAKPHQQDMEYREIDHLQEKCSGSPLCLIRNRNRLTNFKLMVLRRPEDLGAQILQA